MIKNIFLSFALLSFLSPQCPAGRDSDEMQELIKRGRSNGQTPHLMGHNGDLLFGYKKPPQSNTNRPSLLTRGKTFYIEGTSDRGKKN